MSPLLFAGAVKVTDADVGESIVAVPIVGESGAPTMTWIVTYPPAAFTPA